MAVTWNPSDKAATVTLSNGNLRAGSSVDLLWKSVRATESKGAGKWYFEILIVGQGYYAGVGVQQASVSLDGAVGNFENSWGWNGNGECTNWGNYFAAPAGANNDVIVVAVDLDSGKLWFSKNNTWMLSGSPATGTSPIFSNLSGSVYPTGSTYQTNNYIDGRFKQSAFSYTPPSGFSAWEETTVELPRLIQTPQPHSSFTISSLGL